ncbi:MAG: YqiA/YcfP family alpha/beta fold hydrolase [Erysipelotrichaceae bacterium]
MFNWIKNKLIHKPKETIEKEDTKALHALITLHGFGRKQSKEMSNLILWSKEESYEIITLDLYNKEDEKDCNYIDWVNRARTLVETYIVKGYKVDLLGFSMGGVIATYLSTICPINRLILISPAFNYFNLENFTDYLVKGAVNLLNNKKEVETPTLPKSFFGTFMDVVKYYKGYIKAVNVPTLILHGDEDEIIPLRSSLQAFDKIPNDNKRLIILHGGRHRILQDPRVNNEAYQIINLFLNEKILNDNNKNDINSY